MLTRAERDGKLSDLTAAFVQWSLFQCPGIDLDQIEIPIKSFPGGTLPDRRSIDEMLSAVRGNLSTFKRRLDAITFKRLEEELSLFSIDPTELDHSLGPPSLAGTGRGTHFYVMPADFLIDCGY